MQPRIQDARSLLGVETEYHLAVRGSDRSMVSNLALETMAHVKDVVSSVPCSEPSVGGLGVMTGNGGKAYLDLGGLLEGAIPEVNTPREALVYS